MKKRHIHKEFIANDTSAIEEFTNKMLKEGYVEILIQHYYSPIKNEEFVNITYENGDIWTIEPPIREFKEELKKCKCKSDIDDLDMTYAGALNNYEGYELFDERHFVYYKENRDNRTIVTAIYSDTGNGGCVFISSSVYLKSLLDKLNS